MGKSHKKQKRDANGKSKQNGTVKVKVTNHSQQAQPLQNQARTQSHKQPRTDSNHVRTTSASSGVSVGTTHLKLMLPKNYETTDSEIANFCDYSHKSVKNNSVLKHIKGAGSNCKSSSRGSIGKGGTLKSELISTVIDESPELKILKNGFDFYNTGFMVRTCGGIRKWGCREFSHGMSTNFSSPAIALREEDMIGKVDFISDWTNIKSLIKSHSSDSHLSYLIHRVGDSVTVDHMNIADAHEMLQYPAELREFIVEVTNENKEKIKNERNSNKLKEHNEAYHLLMHNSMKTRLRTKPIPPPSDPQAKRKVLIENQFLNHMLLSTEKFKILVGCNVPTFSVIESEGTKQVTIQLSDADATPSEKEYLEHALDLWLNNVLMHSPKTLVTHKKNTVVTKTEWIDTDDLPNKGKFDVATYLEYAENIFNFIRENVKTGNSYWLYRAPGSIDIQLYNLTNISMRNHDGSSSHIFENFVCLEPFKPYFTVTSLTKYSEIISELIPEKLKLNPVLIPLNGTNDNKPGSKLQKLIQKLENHLNASKRIVNLDGIRIIQDVEEIRVKDFQLIVDSFTDVYDHASRLRPKFKMLLRRHGIERLFIMCLRLQKILKEKLESLKDVKFLREDDGMRRWILTICSGICNIISIVKRWYDEVIRCPGSEEERNEMAYVGCRLHVLHAEILTAVAERNHESVNSSLCRRLDQELNQDAKDNLKKIVDLLETAFNGMPTETNFENKQNYFSSALQKIDASQSISKERLRNEILHKLSMALIKLVSYKLTYPSYLYHDFDPSTNTKDLTSPARTTKSKVIHVYMNALKLINRCLNYAKMIEQDGSKLEAPLPFRRADELQLIVINTLIKLKQIDDTKLRNSSTITEKEKETDLDSGGDEIFREKNRGHKHSVGILTVKEEFVMTTDKMNFYIPGTGENCEALDEASEHLYKVIVRGNGGMTLLEAKEMADLDELMPELETWKKFRMSRQGNINFMFHY